METPDDKIHQILFKISSLFNSGAGKSQIFENGVTFFRRRGKKPLLTVEVESMENKLDSIIQKFSSNFKIGIKSCWIVVPAMKGIAVYSDSENYQFFHNDDILKDNLLNIEIDLKKVFI